MDVKKLTKALLGVIEECFSDEEGGPLRPGCYADVAAEAFITSLVAELDPQPVVRFRYDRAVAPEGRAPEYKTVGAAGVDLVASLRTVVPARSRALVPTGLYVEIPAGFEGQIRPRSGLALKAGLTVLNTPGTVDSDYRGILHVLLFNTTDTDETINPGDRVAQMVVSRVVQAKFEEVEQLSETERGEGGWGSTGRR